MPKHFLPTLRSRLTTLYIASTTMVLLLLSGLFSLLLWVALHNQIDHHIHIVTTQAQQIVETFTDEQREILLENLVQMEGMSVLLITHDGNVIMQKNSFDISPLNQNEVQTLVAKSVLAGNHPLHFTVHEQRFGSAVVEENGATLLLAVGYSTQILSQTFRQMIILVVGIIFLTLLPLTYMGYTLLQKYLHPLEEIAETAQEINHPKKLSRRVTTSAQTHEVATIVTSFNEMLGRLEVVFHTEHAFFSDAAHTLKTPLAVLRARIENMPAISDTKKREIVKVIDSAVETVQNLLFISRVETGTVHSAQAQNLSSIAHELAEIALTLSAEKQVTVTTDIEPNSTIFADKQLLKKALGNVMYNAVQYVNTAGKIEISLRQTSERIIFKVSNTGGTISQEEIKKVFNRFYRGKNARATVEGSGLGLAITKAIVENYKGHVKMQIDPKKIVTVSLILPRLQSDGR